LYYQDNDLINFRTEAARTSENGGTFTQNQRRHFPEDLDRYSRRCENFQIS